MRHHLEPDDALRRLDPIHGDRLAAAWADSEAATALLQEITTVPPDTQTQTDTGAQTVPNPTTDLAPSPSRRPSPARRRVRPFAFAATVAVLGVGLALGPGLRSDPDSAAFAVRELPNGVLELDVTPGSIDTRDGQALAAELREYGIDVEVTTLAASPSMVGTVYVFGPDWDLHEGIPPGLSYGEDGTPEVFHYTIDPALFRDTLTIQIALETEPGQPYELLDDAFEPGEALDGLHCAIGRPLRAETLVPYLDELGIAPVWSVASPTDDPDTTSSEVVEEVPAGEVVRAMPLDATTIEIEVVADGVTLPTPYWPDVFADGEPCTPERAAAWR